MRDWARRKYKSLIQTQIAEDGFQRERRKETTSAAKVLNETTAWYTLIKKNVLGKVHRFKQFQMQPMRRGVRKTIDKKQLHRASASKPWDKLSDIQNEASSNATWWTCNSSNWNKPFAHLELQRYCLADPQWPARIDRIALSWLSCMFNRASLLVRPRGTNTWFFAIGTLAQTIGIGWLAEPVHDPQGHVAGYLPQKDVPSDPRELIRYLPVTSVWPMAASEYEAMHFKARGPLATICAFNATHSTASAPAASSSSSGSKPVVHPPPQVMRPGVMAVPLSEPEPLIKAAARTCFAGWTTKLLKDLASHIGVDLMAGDKLFQVLTQLLNHILQPLAEEDLLAILALREFKKDPMDDLLHSEEIVGVGLGKDCGNYRVSDATSRPPGWLARWGDIHTLTQNIWLRGGVRCQGGPHGGHTCGAPGKCCCGQWARVVTYTFMTCIATSQSQLAVLRYGGELR